MPDINYNYVKGNSDQSSLVYQYCLVMRSDNKENDVNYTQYVSLAKAAIENDFNSITGEEKPIIDYKYVNGSSAASLYEYVRYNNEFEIYNLSETIKAEIRSAVTSDYEKVTGNQLKLDTDSNKRYFKNHRGVVGELNVKGYFEVVGSNDYNWDSNVLILSDAFLKQYSMTDGYSVNTNTTKYVAPSDLKYVSAVTLTDNSQEQIAFMLAGEPENDIVRDIDNNVYYGLQMFVGMINSMQLVFLIIGGVVGVFAALMLLNFISTSISAKRKEIGILRAVGARGVDVFKIFFSEAFVIAIICFVLSVVGAGVTCGIINNSVTGLELIPTAKLLDFGLINVGLILAISLFVSAIATFFPVLSASKKPPVESIRAL